jgi:hypothetical protein
VRSNSWDIYGARLNTSGVVIDTFAVSLQPGWQTSPTLAHGAGDQLLITYSGWTDSINGQPVNTMRIWGKFYPHVGTEEHEEFMIHDTRFGLHVYPNPFSKFTDIRYQIPEEVDSRQKTVVSMKIYDATGRLVRQWDYPTIRLSDHISWDGTDQLNRQLGSGVYFVTLQAGDYSATKKLLLIR